MSAGELENEAAAAADSAPSTEIDSGGSGKFKLYTKTGDLGSSCLFNMERRDKDDDVFEALGDVDELGVCVGIARTFAEEHVTPDGEMLARLLEIQSRLLDVGSAVATPLQSSSTAEWKARRVEFAEEHITRLEGWIDEYDESLPPLTTFILPSGGKTAVHLHQARTVCRRAERRVVPLVRDGDCDQAVGRYLNRLSDFLYAAARYAAHREGHEELPYKKAA